MPPFRQPLGLSQSVRKVATCFDNAAAGGFLVASMLTRRHAPTSPRAVTQSLSGSSKPTPISTDCTHVWVCAAPRARTRLRSQGGCHGLQSTCRAHEGSPEMSDDADRSLGAPTASKQGPYVTDQCGAEVSSRVRPSSMGEHAVITRHTAEGSAASATARTGESITRGLAIRQWPRSA